MIANEQELRVTVEQQGRLLRALEDLKETVLPKNPQLFAVLAESCLDDLERLRSEIADYLEPAKATDTPQKVQSGS